MGKIKALSPEEIRKIAAGEVIERPAHIVKELIENALDAGARTIEVAIEDGGKQLIQLTDDGCGMSEQDVRLACVAHATSKINSIDDLLTLQTYGFRGEALSSVAAVSALTIITKEEASDVGIELAIKHGKLVNDSSAVRATGTTIIVRELFDNIPARKKFLKTSDTEFRSITTLFQAYVLAHQHIHFKLFHDGRLIHNCPPVQDVTTRMVQLWSHAIADQLVSIEAADSIIGCACSGVTSRMQYLRYNTAQIFLFVNQRWIKNLSLIRAILKGYEGSLPVGRYPVACLFITIDPAIIDVNIHPRKEEVKFIHDYKVEQLVRQSIKNGLGITLSAQVPLPFFNQPIIAAAREQSVAPIFTPASEPFMPFEPDIQESTVRVAAPIESGPVQQLVTQAPIYRLVGQCLRTYIVLEKDDGVLFVDQHAAHERVLYELFKTHFAQVPSVSLLFPVIVSVGTQDLELLLRYQEQLVRHGIVVDCMGIDQLVIKSVPVSIKHINFHEFISELVAFLQDDCEFEHDYTHFDEKVRIQMACKAAVKAGDELSPDKMLEIIQQLEKIDSRLTCPHGRPTVWFLTASELEKKFRRDYTR